MAASTADLYPTNLSINGWTPFLVASTTQIYLNQLVGVNASGYLLPMSDTAGLIFMGQSNNNVLGGATNGTVSANVSPPEDPNVKYRIMDCTGAAQSWVGSLVYFTDDHTVALSSTNSLAAGRVLQYLTSTQVKVDLSRRS